MLHPAEGLCVRIRRRPKPPGCAKGPHRLAEPAHVQRDQPNAVPIRRTSRFWWKHSEMTEGLFDGRQFVGRALLPLAAFSGALFDAAELPAMGNPEVSTSARDAAEPIFDLLVGRGFAQHNR